MFGFFKKKNVSTDTSDFDGTVKTKAIAFVDFEHWYISLDKMYDHARPDIKAWRDDLASRFEIKEIIFFGDFSNPSLKREIPKIRQVTNYIIETQNSSSAFKKDFTDFIMLDHIYQKAALSPEIETFILFSGDGHFSSVVSYLTTQLGKNVGVYGIRGCMSRQLSESASFSVMIPKEVTPEVIQYRHVLKSLKKLEDSKKKTYPTFWGTVEAVSRQNRLKRKDVAETMRLMLSKGYIYQSDISLDGKNIKVLKVDWKKCRNSGVWED